MFSSWSRTQKNTAPPAGGDLANSGTANLPARTCTRPALPATSPARTATSSLPVKQRHNEMKGFARTLGEANGPNRFRGNADINAGSISIKSIGSWFSEGVHDRPPALRHFHSRKQLAHQSGARPRPSTGPLGGCVPTWRPGRSFATSEIGVDSVLTPPYV